MAKLGYTWYPKDWGNSESVFELNLSERGLYRELIDLAMLNDNKTEIKLDVWSRKFAIDTDGLKSILGKLSILNLIEIKSDKLFIPSCESRLNLVRGGSKGGKNSKPTVKPIHKPSESLLEKKGKPTSNQIEKKVNIKEKEINNGDFAFDSFWSLYPKKVERRECEKLFNKLSSTDKQKIQSTLSSFISYKPFTDYTHPNPKTYLNKQRWNDEIPTSNQPTQTGVIGKTNQLSKTAKDYDND